MLEDRATPLSPRQVARQQPLPGAEPVALQPALPLPPPAGPAESADPARTAETGTAGRETDTEADAGQRHGVPPPAAPADGWPADYPGAYAVVDVETTGLRSDDRIVSAAVYRLDAHGAVEDSWYTLVNPQRDPGPVWIHGLTREVLADAPLFPEIAEEFTARLEGRVLVAHNAVFDWMMIAREYARAGLTAPVRRMAVHHRARPAVAAAAAQRPAGVAGRPLRRRPAQGPRRRGRRPRPRRDLPPQPAAGRRGRLPGCRCWPASR